MNAPGLPDGFTLDDWLELIDFYHAVESEGLLYAAENYPPRFTAPGLPSSSARFEHVELYEKHEPTIEQWLDQTDPHEVERLTQDRDRRRREAADFSLLWAVHPGGDWERDYSKAFVTRAAAEAYFTECDALAARYPSNFVVHPDRRILKRDTPGGPWATAD
ncbi:hypothetical protein C9F11_42825 (plasmid) [Streptomyces sp. YIM 121038]|uniref:hypothetical protein n=1 Tax=Streptomyces sp. YIM 121038 TaxID=2136401 RepID=UPI0011105982|nr:hypothetical protein [Streptomyces sp. YIM 121038]QCX82145.1 hypothetical protein C9F11_42825 [Streptomyces sp. YIM 121038]